jgi:3-hydroxy-3-methylglutaryl CoA synthase
VYLPRRRLARQAIADALASADTVGCCSRRARAFGNWDEDALTMVVEAGRSALRSQAGVTGVTFASTTHPFLDRSNAGLVAEALGFLRH